MPKYSLDSELLKTLPETLHLFSTSWWKKFRRCHVIRWDFDITSHESPSVRQPLHHSGSCPRKSLPRLPSYHPAPLIQTPSSQWGCHSGRRPSSRPNRACCRQCRKAWGVSDLIVLVLQPQTVLAMVVTILASTDPAISWTLILPSPLVLLFTSVLLLRCTYLVLRVLFIMWIAAYQGIRLWKVEDY